MAMRCPVTMRYAASLAALSALVVVTACQDPTQVRMVVSTRGVACLPADDALTSTTLISGEADSALDARRTISTNACTPRADGAFVGDLVYAPSGSKDTSLSLEVYFGLDGQTPEACRSDCDDRCILARRRLSFVPQQKLLMPIVAEPSCRGECCDEGTTCIGGACVELDEVPTCDDEGGADCPSGAGGGAGVGGAGGQGAGGMGGGGQGGGMPVVGATYEPGGLLLGSMNETAFVLTSSYEGTVAFNNDTVSSGPTGTAGFIADTNQKLLYHCASTGGPLRFVRAVRVDDTELAVLMTTTGTFDCVAPIGSPYTGLVNAGAAGRRAYILRLREGEPTLTIALGLTAASNEMYSPADLAKLAGDQLMVVGYLQGTLTEIGPGMDQVTSPGGLAVQVVTLTGPTAVSSTTWGAGGMPVTQMGVARLGGGALVVGRSSASIDFGVNGKTFAPSNQPAVFVAVWDTNTDNFTDVNTVSGDAISVSLPGQTLGAGLPSATRVGVWSSGGITLDNVSTTFMGPSCVLLSRQVMNTTTEVAIEENDCTGVVVARAASALTAEEQAIFRINAAWDRRGAPDQTFTFGGSAPALEVFGYVVDGLPAVAGLGTSVPDAVGPGVERENAFLLTGTAGGPGLFFVKWGFD